MKEISVQSDVRPPQGNPRCVGLYPWLPRATGLSACGRCWVNERLSTVHLGEVTLKTITDGKSFGFLGTYTLGTPQRITGCPASSSG